MKVDSSRTIYEEVEIGDREIKRIAFEYIAQKTGWRPSYYVKNGKVCVDEEYCTSHCWDETREIREATEEDIIAESFVKRLK